MFGIKPFLLLAMLTLSRFCTQNDVARSSPRYMSSDIFCFPYFSSQPTSDVTLRNHISTTAHVRLNVADEQAARRDI